MKWVKYGGIQKYGQLLNGWLEHGVLGEEVYIAVPQMAAGGGGALAISFLPERPWKRPFNIVSDDEEVMELVILAFLEVVE